MTDFTDAGGAGGERGQVICANLSGSASLANNRIGHPTADPIASPRKARKSRASASGQRGHATLSSLAGSATHLEFGTADHHDPDVRQVSVSGSDSTTSVGLELNEAQGYLANAADQFDVDGHLIDVARCFAVINIDSDPADAGGGDSHSIGETQASGAVSPELIHCIRAQWRMRQAWHRAEKSLTLQAKAICRGFAVEGDKKEAGQIYDAAFGKGAHPMAEIALSAFLPIVEARNGIETHRLKIEKLLGKLAKELPVAPWVKDVRGISMVGLASIVGGAGNLSAYSNPAKLWKRMGLAVMPDNTRQRRVAGPEGVAHGYSPARRSEMWNIGNGLIGGMGRGKRPVVGEDISLRDDWSPLEKLFVERLRYEAARDPENMARPATDESKESFSKHAANRAKRYVEKRFLRLLWQQWRNGGDQCSIDDQGARVAPVQH